MPIVPFETLPDASRVWIFGSDRALSGADAERLLSEVDRFLPQWKAHGVPLACARDWRDEHLLTIAVDSTVETASGCSIDGLFRVLQAIEKPLGTRLVAAECVSDIEDGTVGIGERSGFLEPGAIEGARRTRRFCPLEEHYGCSRPASPLPQEAAIDPAHRARSPHRDRKCREQVDHDIVII